MRRPLLVLTLLLGLTASALAQDQPGLRGMAAVTADTPASTTTYHTVNVDGTRYTVEQWRSADGTRSDLRVTQAPDLGDIIGAIVEARRAKAAEKRMYAEHYARYMATHATKAERRKAQAACFTELEAAPEPLPLQERIAICGQ